MKKLKVAELFTDNGFRFVIRRRTIYGKLLNIFCKYDIPKFTFFADFSERGVDIGNVYLEGNSK